MGDLTIAQIKDFAIVGAALAGFVVLLGNLIKTIKDWKQPGDDIVKWRREVDRKLDNDNQRLEVMEKGNRVISRGILALLSHEINGNSDDKLKASQAEITNYPIDR